MAGLFEHPCTAIRVNEAEYFFRICPTHANGPDNTPKKKTCSGCMLFFDEDFLEIMSHRSPCFQLSEIRARDQAMLETMIQADWRTLELEK